MDAMIMKKRADFWKMRLAGPALAFNSRQQICANGVGAVGRPASLEGLIGRVSADVCTPRGMLDSRLT